jgi:endonuclease-3
VKSSNSKSLKAKVKRISLLLEKRYGIPRREREVDPLESLIQTILSQNTNDRNRDRAFQRLKTRFPSWEDLAKARPGVVVQTLRPGGLAKQKTRRIFNLFQWMREQEAGLSLAFLKGMSSEKIKKTLGSLKGIGPKTVHCLLLFGMGREAFPVDTHIHRVGKRLGFIPERMNAGEAHQWMAPLVAKGKSLSLHLNLIKLGRSICKAKNPQCSDCFLKRQCSYRKVGDLKEQSNRKIKKFQSPMPDKIPK